MATAEVIVIIIIIIAMDIEDTARRSHLSRIPKNPSNLLQAVKGQIRVKKVARLIEWAMSCVP